MLISIWTTNVQAMTCEDITAECLDTLEEISEAEIPKLVATLTYPDGTKFEVFSSPEPMLALRIAIMVSCHEVLKNEGCLDSDLDIKPKIEF